ncbi:MAG: excinuclease ABC subunit UvrB [Mollicutes bacterium PWAP]|nr:excinuclease ABC subunit UvrB [Mollicutes bacterium PWAP]
MKNFELITDKKPSGDQPSSIKKLVQGLKNGEQNQVLLGATGTGKTFTIANVIKESGKPTLVLSHNKTLASQLYTEFKEIFPNNKVEYFISYFDYYKPEAYIPSSDTFIDKTSKGNVDIEAMRMSALNSLLSHNDVIVVASVASIYGALNREEYAWGLTELEIGQVYERTKLLRRLIEINYNRTKGDLVRGSFRVVGETFEIVPGWTDDFYLRLDFFGDELDSIEIVDPLNKNIIQKLQKYTIYPGDAYTIRKTTLKNAIPSIEKEFKKRLDYFEKEGKILEKERLKQRISSDIESLKEFGMTSGIENYSMYLDGRNFGERPYTIMDYFPKNSLMVIDESHMMIPQLHAMYKGDRSRKENLVEYGFRLPSALENRPLRFEEWENAFPWPKIFVSATPSNYEIEKSGEKNIVKQIIRPTGLLDPKIEVIPYEGQVDFIYDKLIEQRKVDEKSFILTTTKRFSEELSSYLKNKKIKSAYIHSEHKTFERNEIIRKLRVGVYEVIIGINLLREGMDVPEVSKVFVMDSDKESFLRSKSSLIQIIGRAARNVNGIVYLFGNKISRSMKLAIDETENRRKIQIIHNKKNGITPKTIFKKIPEPIHVQGKKNEKALELSQKMNAKEKSKLIASLRGQMLMASRKMNFEEAARIRDLILELECN